MIENPIAQGKGQKGFIMMYPDLLTANDVLAKHLYSFAGHLISPSCNAYMYEQLAEALDYIKRVKPAISVTFDATMWYDSGTIPLLVTIAGTDKFEPVDVTVQRVRE